MTFIEGPPDRWVDVDGVRLAVDDRNPDHPGVALVLVHGFTGGRVDFADVIDELATDRRVIAWDHRGHADSTNTGDPATYSFARLARDAAAVLDQLGVDRIDLLGHSMGGVVSMTYALDYTDRIRSLVLMDTGATPFTALPQAWLDQALATGRGEGMAALGDQMAAMAESTSMVPAAARARSIERLRAKHAAMDVEAFDALGHQLRTFEPLLERLADELHCPVTVVVGEHDIGLRAKSDVMASAVPGAELVVIPDAAHSPQDENPEVWLAAVRAHLARTEIEVSDRTG
jgi:pimeloyl-ACP methyl ester carboxylesterase